VFTGSTERKALDWLVARGAQVKVSYDTQSTRLHAKAWLFQRQRLFHRLHRLVKSFEVGARGRRGMERAPVAGGLAGHYREVRCHFRKRTGKVPNTSRMNLIGMPLASIAL
jgi:hypothetical protein